MPRRPLQRLDGDDPAVLAIAEVHRAGGFTVPLVADASPPRLLTNVDIQVALRHAAVLALRAAGFEVLAQRGSEVHARCRRGRWQYRRPGRRGAWAQHDPDASVLAAILRPVDMARVRAGRSGAKAGRDAAIVETFEALGLVPRPVPERSRAALVATLHQCTARHVRAVLAAWQRKKSGTD